MLQFRTLRVILDGKYRDQKKKFTSITSDRKMGIFMKTEFLIKSNFLYGYKSKTYHCKYLKFSPNVYISVIYVRLNFQNIFKTTEIFGLSNFLSIVLQIAREIEKTRSLILGKMLGAQNTKFHSPLVILIVVEDLNCFLLLKLLWDEQNCVVAFNSEAANLDPPGNDTAFRTFFLDCKRTDDLINRRLTIIDLKYVLLFIPENPLVISTALALKSNVILEITVAIHSRITSGLRSIDFKMGGNNFDLNTSHETKLINTLYLLAIFMSVDDIDLSKYDSMTRVKLIKHASDLDTIITLTKSLKYDCDFRS
ncbi:hypothetical protein AGLY_004742 [Aphis glycines]|uniref:Uncharacterized protein n=1 Tax=Aphis glycines TaxID=307491 RepID=A0A6G0TV90_APHGL|nr:hypothetical protein AGLY_004742 [Aphis glycines]